MNILILNNITTNYLQLQAERDAVRALLLAGHAPLSLNLCYNQMQLTDNMLEYVLNLYVDMFDDFLFVEKANWQPYIIKFQGYIYSVGMNIHTDLASIGKVEGFPSPSQICKMGHFETIAPNGHFLKRIVVDDAPALSLNL